MSYSRLQPLAVLAVSLVSTVALACPDCPTARGVRASVMGEDFWGHLMVVVVPFLLIGALSALLYRVGLSPRDVSAARAREESEVGS
ncbi:hypothetical protein JRI60_15790 [Archangium violaceum]|uniref:hypothetical protein n=1 Tax=Archangium violaceum TaxID=83451 RepID=UPI001950A8F8|nr:hypothetical protein [Archangium violaceum]QRO00382.1 hypothetical protein JRI60_15790 [Archangium violaceum]